MPYLPTSQSYLEQSSLLLQAYPDTRITTKYTFPRTSTSTKPSSTTQPTSTEETEPKPRIAVLELKTYHPGSGICLKYRTNKGAEVGRLITSLGKLAAGADVEGLGLGNNPAAVPASGAGAGDVEMGDAPAVAAAEGQTVAGEGVNSGAAGKGGKGKKKGGKGKR
ncbi:hypothetical protein BO79DRAFT_290653 [Aspergillus costaricaensis CBS 115574]|uniref:Uncharacterized protein n=1 Tax=Aspergillus costaricaensis CBS 115574 TaxID=1448317 RepID=A0ACD1I1W3_9EURO|nr:hypothetical protein BO79DRAFT_290653 [Aspergillus costaricaensis CBS 115574]RAK84212.1 hypothetical protein BO79DRAFT_290653 [Aspergillus costaricaensis CBS 115574]